MIYELRLCIVCTLERLFQVADQTKPLEYIFSKIGYLILPEKIGECLPLTVSVELGGVSLEFSSSSTG